MKFEMNERWGEIFVGTALALRGTSLLFSKVALRTMNPYLLIGMRNIIAFVLVAIVFRKRLTNISRKAVLHSALLGFALFMSMAFELAGLKTTPSTVTAFLECTIIVIVPIMTCILWRKFPDSLTVISTIVAMIGVGLLTLKGDHISFSTGELFIFGGSLWYGVSVIVTDNAAKNDDPSQVAVLQLLFIALFGFIAAALFEDVRLPDSSTEWAAVFALAVICSSLGFTLQPFGQKYTTPERAGLLTLLNPLAAAALGIIFLNEKMTLSMVLGAIIIVLSILLPAIIRERSKEEAGRS